MTCQHCNDYTGRCPYCRSTRPELSWPHDIQRLNIRKEARNAALEEAALRIENDDPLLADHIRALKEG